MVHLSNTLQSSNRKKMGFYFNEKAMQHKIDINIRYYFQLT